MKASFFFAAVILASVSQAESSAECMKRGGKWMHQRNATGCMVRGQRDGEWTTSLPGGQVVARSQWVKGKETGPIERYYNNCQIAQRGNLVDGHLEGHWTYWDEEGKKSREGSYERNKMEGVWIEYHPETGNKRLEGPFLHNAEEGEFTEYLPQGEKWRVVKFHAGRRVGPEHDACAAREGEWTIDFKQRREGCLVDYKEEGVWQGHDGAGKLRWRAPYAKGKIEGLYEEFHPQGKLLRKGMYVHSVPEGRHEFRALDGTLLSASTVVEGTGDWQSFHPNGQMSEAGRYEKGCPSGLWRFWNEEGRLTKSENFADCKREGPAVWYHNNGKKRLVGQFHQGKAIDAWKAFYSNGDPDWEGNYQGGERSGSWRFWRWGNQLRAEGPMEADMPKGEWTEYYPTGKPSQTGLRIGMNNEGPWKTYWSTGEPWREVKWVHGEEQDDAAKACEQMKGVWHADGEKRTLGCLVCRAGSDDVIQQVGAGVWTYWHPNGFIEKQGELIEGKPSGVWRFFHDNGEVMMRGAFDAGVETGDWSGAYRSGQPRFRGSYVDGKPDGLWVSHLQDGGVLSVGRYEKGVKVGPWQYERNILPSP